MKRTIVGIFVSVNQEIVISISIDRFLRMVVLNG